MANIYSNQIAIIGDRASLENFLRAAVGEDDFGENTSFSFAVLLPPPDEIDPDSVKEGGVTGRIVVTSSGEKLVFPVYPLADLFGRSSAENCWKRLNWGLDTDRVENLDYVIHDLVGGSAMMDLYFETEWAPPVAFFKAMSQRYPDLKFYMAYADVVDPLAGHLIAADGEVREDFLSEEDIQRLPKWARRSSEGAAAYLQTKITPAVDRAPIPGL